MSDDFSTPVGKQTGTDQPKAQPPSTTDNPDTDPQSIFDTDPTGDTTKVTDAAGGDSPKANDGAPPLDAGNNPSTNQLDLQRTANPSYTEVEPTRPIEDPNVSAATAAHAGGGGDGRVAPGVRGDEPDDTEMTFPIEGDILQENGALALITSGGHQYWVNIEHAFIGGTEVTMPRWHAQDVGLEPQDDDNDE